MFKNREIILVLFVFIALLLAGCRCDNSVIPAYYGIGDTPADGEVTSLTPSFDWHGSDSCEPDEYLFRIEGAETVPVQTNIGPGGLPFLYTGTGLMNPLEPGKAYTWFLTAINGSQGSDPPVFGPKTEIGQFFTGPICSGEALVAPDLLDPEPAGWVDEDPYLFRWTYNGGCLPESYEIQFALDPGFTTISMTVSTTELYEQEILMTFLDCTSLWWRVRAYDGSSYGPWSAGRDFHYIQSGDCWQWQYVSENMAWIHVHLGMDICQQTGLLSAITPAPLDYGCMAEGTFIVGEGISGGLMRDYVVDLGSGPCPSTGLDQKTAGYSATFGVLTPGTYCVSISRNQTAEYYGSSKGLMDGLWTDPRVNQVIAEKTIDLPPHNSTNSIHFVWDEREYPFLLVPLGHTFDCKIGPQKVCPTYEYARAGDAIPIIARDDNSDWKLTEINGTACYLNLPAALIQQYMPEDDNVGSLIAGLPLYVDPDPCPEPESDNRTKTCADYTSQGPCERAGCTWVPVSDTQGFCLPGSRNN